MKILVVEDDEEIRAVVREILEGIGHTCAEASDGLEAKKILETNENFDLLVSDFRMPNMDGVALLEWCRSHKIHFPVIFLSANAGLLDREKLALSDCCAALLQKPVELEQLLEAVSAAKLRRHHRDC